MNRINITLFSLFLVLFLCLSFTLAAQKEVARDGVYVAYANGIVKDTKTGLEWNAGPDKNTNWEEAKSWVQELDLDGGGWRMPTIDELQSLYKPKSTQYNRTPLLKCTGYRVWSGEAKDSSEAWYFEFMYSGEFKQALKRRCSISFGYSRSLRAFAVRSQSD